MTFVPVLLAAVLLVAVTARGGWAQADTGNAAASDVTALPMAAGVDARLITGPEQLRVGDIGTLTVEVKHPAGLQVFVPPLGDTWGDFEIVARDVPETVASADGTETTRQSIRVRLFAPGDFATPALAITISDAAGNLAQAVAQPVVVPVTSVLPEGDTLLRDIKPQASLPAPLLHPAVWIGLVSVLAALLLAYWGPRHLAGRRTTVDTRTPVQVALDDLETIAASNLVGEGRMKEHAGRVTNTLRAYLGRQYNVDAVDRTTAELRRLLRDLDMSEEHALQFGELFAAADLIKFADVQATPEVGHRLLEQARQWVQDTDAELVARRSAQRQRGNTNPPAHNAAAAGL